MAWAALSGAFVFGLMTAISPCPLTTNIAAISFLGRQGRSRQVMLSALLYTLGRTIVYVGLGIGLLWAFRSVGGGQGELDEFASPVSRFLQHYGSIALGPILLFFGMVFLRLIELNFSIGVSGTALQQRVARGGSIWALPLGMLFALAFCPPSVFLFLSALGLAVTHDAMVLPPVAYGIGTALPVVAFATVIAFASQGVSRTFISVSLVERVLRTIAGVVFVAAGIYYILKHIYDIPFFG